MKYRRFGLILTLFAAIIFIAACSPGPSATPTSPSTLDGATLVQERCSACHPLTFVERSRHSESEWQVIVNVMISRGAQLSPAEEAAAVSWLTANFGK